uniref:KOW domain-containing protein n=1 Tax=Cyclophora tenuis TaxID=216820 RepID=A0A7S1GK33_CYCTE
MPQHRADQIFRLAYTSFRPENLIDRIIFLDEEDDNNGRSNGKLCGSSNNKWFEAYKIQATRHVPVRIQLNGQTVFVDKVMFFKKIWLRLEYKRPLMNNCRRLQRILALKKSPHEVIRTNFHLLFTDDLNSTFLLDEDDDDDDQDDTVLSNNDSVNTPGSINKIGRRFYRRKKGIKEEKAPPPIAINDTVEIVGHDQERLNGLKGIIEETPVAAGGRFKIILLDEAMGGVGLHIEAKNLQKVDTTTKTKNTTNKVGQLVMIEMHEEAALKGSYGIIESIDEDRDDDEGEIKIRLSEVKVVSAKAENLKVVVETVD